VIRLFSSEFLRARSRRVVWVIVVGCSVATVLIVGYAAIRSESPKPLQGQALEAYQQAQDQCLQRSNVPAGYASREQFCADHVLPQYYQRGGHDVLRFDSVVDLLKGGSFIVLILALVLGASFIGADWHTGSMSTILAWEPRRIRVLLVRAVISGIMVAMMAIVLQAVLVGSVWLGAALRGSTDVLEQGFWRQVFEAGARVTALAVLTSWIGLALATIGRNTAAALGVLLGYVAVFEALFRGLNPSFARNLLISNMAVVVDAKAQIIVYDQQVIELTFVRASWVVLIYAVAMLAIGAVVFRARDVT
jgi:ABC-2 type transport system permease protein